MYFFAPSRAKHPLFRNIQAVFEALEPRTLCKTAVIVNVRNAASHQHSLKSIFLYDLIRLSWTDMLADCKVFDEVLKIKDFERCFRYEIRATLMKSASLLISELAEKCLQVQGRSYEHPPAHNHCSAERWLV